MIQRINRRRLIGAGAALAVSTVLPRHLWATGVSINDIQRSAWGFATTCDEVAAAYDLTGKTVLITGCNSGLGYESMRTLAARGARVLGAARTMEKAQEACSSVKGITTPLVCELTNFDSIVACADAVNELDFPIDVLMCNAGIMALPKLEQVNVSGVMLEKQFVVNHLGHYVLTRRLLSQVAAAKAGRIVVLSSIGYKNAPPEGIQFDNLSGESNYRAFTMYGQTKLANALFSRELARRHAGTSVTSNSVHPGMVATDLGRYISGKPRDPDAPLRKGFKTAAQGAATQVYVAIDSNLDGVSGHYFEDCNPVVPESALMTDDALALKLWDVSAELTADYL